MELPLHDVEPGMMTLEAVCDRSGRVLVGDGVSLDVKQLKLLKAWGIRSISIRDVSVSSDSAENAVADFESLEQEAAQLFDPADLTHPLVKKLIPFTARQMAKSAGGGRG